VQHSRRRHPKECGDFQVRRWQLFLLVFLIKGGVSGRRGVKFSMDDNQNFPLAIAVTPSQLLDLTQSICAPQLGEPGLFPPSKKLFFN